MHFSTTTAFQSSILNPSHTEIKRRWHGWAEWKLAFQVQLFRDWLSDQSLLPPSYSLRKFGWKVIERRSVCCYILSLAFLTETTNFAYKQNCNARVSIACVTSLINRAKKSWHNAQHRTGAKLLLATVSSERKHIEDFPVCGFFHWLYSRWWNTKYGTWKIAMALWKNVVDFYDITFQWIYSDSFLWVMVVSDGFCCICLSMSCIYFKLIFFLTVHVA